MSKSIVSSRLEWLDMLRILCAIEIAGHHWLRACMHINIFSNNDLPGLFRNFLWSYKNNNAGLELINSFPKYLILDNQNNLAAFLTNLTGFLFGFGWEALHVFIFMSGFSLSLRLVEPPNNPLNYWLNWYKKRIKRIILPYYFVAFILFAGFLLVYITVNTINFPLFEPVKMQLQDKIGRSWIEILIGHVFLVNPWQTGWATNFISSAWWFIPPLLVAYIAFPLYFKVLTRFGGKFLLAITLLISVGSYYFAQSWGLNENHWHYIILFESFNFALGIFLGNYYTNYQDKEQLQKVLFHPLSLVLGLVLVVVGNMMNWFSSLYPWSSLFFTFGLFILGAKLANFLIEVPFLKRLKNCDSYVFYLIHQLIAYLFALCLNYVLKGYTPFFGGIIYILTVILVTSVFVKFYDSTTKFISSRFKF
ncbi:acyltransferase [Pseudanabaena sp. FACHB-1998]|uniref:acyltransferase family protein n=1 Tax=Pseudanabaena sp. FACHB-1998 TaxID=2692858 RepID=UPI00168185C9|nr:acyltransferase [Pseudanabaena sp. FACHB-1998]MBD2178290.1 acyltransferase [Pseudanabaena sp. FACHB-1998]